MVRHIESGRHSTSPDVMKKAAEVLEEGIWELFPDSPFAPVKVVSD